MPTLWERFTDWVISDVYTLEERELIAQRARRLKLATDLQERRIKERLAREARKKGDFRTVAVWKLHYRLSGEPVIAHYYLQETPRLSDGSAYRRIDFGPVVTRQGGKVKQPYSELGPFERAQEAYTRYVLPWNEWSISTKELEQAKAIEVVRKPKAS
jgi:hypothetical protein